MERKTFAVFVLLLCSSLFLFAGGKRDKEEKKLGSESSWQETFDIDGRNGKYNVYVTAEDTAGNEGIAGPFNIFIDKESDLPVSNISNPSESMRVVGNLNIVGTCSDDDKVAAVYLILDGDTSNPILANGTDFWSYYLDTSLLKEGPHTIEAYGVDDGNPEAYRDEEGKIDESKVKPKTGHTVKVTWQLDRRAPVTKVTNMDMGSLVSGKVNFEGVVTDGNGIASLEYSIDGGQTYSPVKLKEVKLKTPDEEGLTSHWTFTLPIDTKRMNDGPMLCWFKAIDMAGSVGKSSFLYFVDNTPPDVKIITPEESSTVCGKFTVAGYAKDTVGIHSLSYSWGSKTGTFELVSGNPYWAIELDSTEVNRSMNFIVTAVDTMGNIVSKTLTFQNNELAKAESSSNKKKSGSGNIVYVNQGNDRPKVEIKFPVGDIDGEDGNVFIRGIATDNQGVASVTYKLDGGEERTVATTGVFYDAIPGALSSGSHTITAWATDVNGLKGTKVTQTFTSKGIAPEFGQTKYNGKDCAEGEPLDPEAGGSFELPVTSTCGLTAVHYDLNWGTSSIISEDLNIEGEQKKAVVKIPLGGDEIPWGIVRLTVTAKDKYERVSTRSVILNIMDLTKPYSKDASVVFSDSTVSEDGTITVDESNSVTGYFVGGTIASVQTVPAVRGLTASASGNVITLTSADATAPFVVRVVTTSGARYDSRTMHFPSMEDAPVLTLNDRSLETGVLNNFAVTNKLALTGTVTSGSAASVKYRILSTKVTYDENGTVISSEKLPEPSLSQAANVSLGRNGSFTINITSENIPDGISVVEVIATNASGKYSAKAAIIRKISNPASAELLGLDAASVTPADPATYWLHGDGEGMDYYGVCVYQGDVASIFTHKKYSELPEGKSTLSFNGANLTVTKDAQKITGRFAKVDGKAYGSGMNVVVVRGGNSETDPHTATVKIVSSVPVATVSWTIDGKSVSAGEIRPLEDGKTYEADVSLSGLSAGMKTIVAKVNGSTEITGHVSIVRTHDVRDSEEKIYWAPVKDVTYDNALRVYKLDDGAAMTAYVNATGKLSASLVRAQAGLSVTVDGNIVSVHADRDGTYSNVSVRVTSIEGGSWVSPAVSLLVDTAKPQLSPTSVVHMSYVKDRIALSGTVSDGNGIASLEYTMVDDKSKPAAEDSKNAKEGETPAPALAEQSEWHSLSVSRNGSFNATLDISSVEDGYIPLTLRAVDGSGKISYFNTVFQKDTHAPEVKILVPEPGAKINGENLFVFSIKDEGMVSSFSYISPNRKVTRDFDLRPGVEAEESTMRASLPRLHLGNAEYPIDNNMTFVVKDVAGNETRLDSFEFAVDPESDLPVVEIHTPLENAVLTTDFVISGIIYDDDGMKNADGTKICKTYYKVDNGTYAALDNPEGLSSFEIVVKPLTILTDNEHEITVYVEDINGVRGKEVSRKFRVSLDEPRGDVTNPTMDQTIHGPVTISGWAQDKNGIGSVKISLDYGATYNDVNIVQGSSREDRAEWNYTFDTNIIADGTHVVFIRITDNYGVSSLYTSQLNIDNTPPTLKLELPLDDSTIVDNLFFSGQTTDNIALTDLYITIRSLEGKAVPQELSFTKLRPETIISQGIDISSLADGLYNIELTGKDNAGNTTNVSRNIKLKKNAELSKVGLMYPLNGEHVQGEFNIYGTAVSEPSDPIQTLRMVIDGEVIPGFEAAPTLSGYFRFTMKEEIKLDKKLLKQELKDGVEGELLGEEDVEQAEVEKNKYILSAGLHTYRVIAVTASGKTISSNEQVLDYNPYGPWITIDDNFTFGDFASHRPMLRGKAGYALTPEEKEARRSKSTPSEEKAALNAKTVKRVFISLDNGRTYIPVSGNGKSAWQYRLEDQDLAEGYHFLLVKAEMENGENATTRLIVQIDHTLPTIRLISPGEGGHYNQQLAFEGLTSDDVKLENVNLILRKGDKASYGVPGFIQGLYFDANVWGSTLWSAGLGLTAFDDAVKIQVSFGQFTQDQRNLISDVFQLRHTNLRYGGNVVSAKIIAQLGYLPFNYFLGHDFDWLSGTIAVGANFSYFSDSGARQVSGADFSGFQILSAALVQVEFPRVTSTDRNLFRTWAVYYEPQLWFIPSDISSASIDSMVFTFSVGFRMSVF